MPGAVGLEGKLKIRKGMRKLSKQNLEDMIMGCCYLGSGGGGSYDAGLKRIHDDLAAGLTFNLMSVDEMNDDDYAATTYYVGSTAPYTPEQRERFDKLPRIKEEATAVAFRLLQKYTGKNFVAVFAGEIGAGNTPYALSTAAHLGIAQLDADTAGRAVPEIDQSTIFAAGISLLPAAAATLFGDEVDLACRMIGRRSQGEPGGATGIDVLQPADHRQNGCAGRGVDRDAAHLREIDAIADPDPGPPSRRRGFFRKWAAGVVDHARVVTKSPNDPSGLTTR